MNSAICLYTPGISMSIKDCSIVVLFLLKITVALALHSRSLAAGTKYFE
jgi:hypothetical protein